MTSQLERSAPPDARPKPASPSRARSRRSIASYFLHLLGMGRAAGHMSPLNVEPPPAEPGELLLGGNPHASDEERRRRGEAFGKTHDHPDAA